MIQVEQLLYQICEDPRVFTSDIDLVESGILDSYAMIELFSELEAQGIELQPTQIDRKQLRTVKGIEQLIRSYMEEDSKEKI